MTEHACSADILLHVNIPPEMVWKLCMQKPTQLSAPLLLLSCCKTTAHYILSLLGTESIKPRRVSVDVVDAAAAQDAC
jgi:hypothetical protein